MARLHQIALKTPRKKKGKFVLSVALRSCPHKKAVCMKITTMKPRKPNSATRKIAKARFSTGQYKFVYLQGMGHSMIQYSVVLVRGGKVRDLPGVRYHAIRGKEDFVMAERIIRGARRSKFGLPCRRKNVKVIRKRKDKLIDNNAK